MRPDLLNPLFAEIEVLKGIGPALAKPLAKLGLARIIDLLFHLPTGIVHRQRIARLDDAAEGSIVSVEVTPTEYRQGGPRSPFRVFATDSQGDVLTLTYFGGGGGYARKLLPLGEKRLVSGKLEQYGQERQIVHPDYVLSPDEGAKLPESEAVYPLSEGLTGRRLSHLVEQAMPRAPELQEWIEPSLLASREWPAWRAALEAIHHNPSDGRTRERLAYDEVFANQLALMLVLIPIYNPLLKIYGFDEIWFYTLFLVVATVGGLTPPFGYTLFALKSAAPTVAMTDIFKAAWPFVWIIVGGIFIMAIFPGIVTYLPNLMSQK